MPSTTRGRSAVDDTKAVFFASGAEEAHAFRREWIAAGVPLPLDVSEAPFRDLGDPLLRYLRAGDGRSRRSAVNVVLPEVVVRGWRRVLHNQRALYIKRLLLFEPRVILSSVPYQLFR